jgi:putative ABC transport system ATP-binding protein
VSGEDRSAPWLLGRRRSPDVGSSLPVEAPPPSSRGALAPLSSSRSAWFELRGLTKIYGKGEAAVHALDGIDMRIEAREFVAVMGSSGSGKSTCMNIVGCLDTPTGGQYLFHGVDVGSLDQDQRALLRRNYIGFVFQGFNLLARTSAVENVELPLIYRHVPRAERRVRAMRALEVVGLADRARHTPAELSGGQQQRVAIARALVTDPSMLLADEPTGNLDSARSLEIMELLARLNDERGITIVMVTHEPDMAAFAKRVVVFRDGHIVEDRENHRS